MVKLTQKEIHDIIEVESAFISEDAPIIPEDAHSKFYFEIEEDIVDLVKEMSSTRYTPQKRHIDEETGEVFFTGGKGHIGKKITDKIDVETGEVFCVGGKNNPKKDWLFVRIKGYNKQFADYELIDPDFNSSATVKDEGNKLHIVTAWSGFVYDISQKENGGCFVEFSGPLNGLLRQNLLPSMTYTPGTLQGKFVSADEQTDLTPYLDIDTYCFLRAEKNRSKENEQDGYGAHVNVAFNNEIPMLNAWEKRPHKTEQEKKLEQAQRNFDNGYKLPTSKIEENKKRFRKQLQMMGVSLPTKSLVER